MEGEEEFKRASGTFESERKGWEGGAMRLEEDREPVGWWAMREDGWGVRRRWGWIWGCQPRCRKECERRKSQIGGVEGSCDAHIKRHNTKTKTRRDAIQCIATSRINNKKNNSRRSYRDPAQIRTGNLLPTFEDAYIMISGRCDRPFRHRVVLGRRLVEFRGQRSMHVWCVRVLITWVA